MTAEDRACAVQLLRSAAADHLTHLDPAERDELVERISAAIDRCARRRAAEELESWARSFRRCGQMGLRRDSRRVFPQVADVLEAGARDLRGEALAHHEEAL